MLQSQGGKNKELFAGEKNKRSCSRNIFNWNKIIIFVFNYTLPSALHRHRANFLFPSLEKKKNLYT